MSTFAALFACQLLAAAAALTIIARNAYVLLLVAPLDTPRFARTLRDYLDAGDFACARSLAERLRPAYCAQLAAVVLQAREEGADLRSALAEQLDDLRERAVASIFIMRTLGRIAPPLAFAVAIVTLASGTGRDVGLLALQRGLAESIAVGNAMLAVVTGMTVSLVCRACAGVLTRRGRALQVELNLTAAVFAPRPEAP